MLRILLASASSVPLSYAGMSTELSAAATMGVMRDCGGDSGNRGSSLHARESLSEMEFRRRSIERLQYKAASICCQTYAKNAPLHHDRLQLVPREEVLVELHQQALQVVHYRWDVTIQ